MSDPAAAEVFRAMLLGAAVLVLCVAVLVGSGVVLFLRLERSRERADPAGARDLPSRRRRTKP